MRPFGWPECKPNYLRAIADWEAGWCKPAPAAGPEKEPDSTDLTVAELALAYRQFTAGYYVKNGRPTTEQHDIQLSTKPLREMFGHSLVADFTPPMLKAVRQVFIDAELCRNEVNKRTRRLVRIFAWGVEEGLVPSPVFWGLKAVKGIKKQRSATGLKHRRFSVTPLQVGQERRPLLRGSRLPQDLPSVDRLSLAWRLSARPIR